jgi:ankyrin repeat protein
MSAAYNGHTSIVRYLLEQGANVNLRANDGVTAASIAYDRGNVDIYDYLMANGAREFEQRQVAQQPASPSSTTNVYVQPSAPAQSSTPAPARNPAPAPSAPTFQTGTYAWSNSGQNMTMQFNVGMVFAQFNNRQIWRGTYSVNGTQLVISVTSAISDYSSLQGMTYSYTITSNTSFSGSGETWVRTGY